MIDRNELQRLCQDPSLSLAQIAARLGVSRQRIHQVIKREGLSKPRPVRPPRPTIICPRCGGRKSDQATLCRKCFADMPHGGVCTVDSKGYRRLPRHLQKRHGLLFEHQLVAMQKIGRPLRDGEEVHHIDGNPMNNHPDNLMVVTRAEHIAIDKRYERIGRRRYFPRYNRTGYRGVKPSGDKFTATISINGKQHYLGTFDTVEQAAAVYDAKAIEAHGEYAILNFPEAAHAAD